MDRNPTAAEIVDSIGGRRTASHDLLCIYWVETNGDRDALRREINTLGRAEGVAAVILRKPLFLNPNAIGSDIVSLLEENKVALLREWEGRPERLSVVILSRSELGSRGGWSPVPLPEWLPSGGSTVSGSRLESLNWAIESSLAHDELHAGEIAELLWQLERALQRRFRALSEGGVGIDAIREWLRSTRHGRDAEREVPGFLDGAHEALEEVRNPDSFRPSLRDGRLFVARVLRGVYGCSLEELLGRSDVVAKALSWVSSGCEHSTPSLSVVLWRSHIEPSCRREQREVRDAMVVAFVAFQLLTAAAHADVYATFPKPVLRAMSFDVRRGLANLIESIRAMPMPV